ncbi:MAG: tyrosine-type recombinase/integrase, partial [Trebonia sp.]
DVRDSTGTLVDFNRTHRFRHTVATCLLNGGVPIHVLQRYLGHLTPTMSMTYAQTLQSTAEAEFLRYRKITADSRDLDLDPRDVYDMLELDRRTDRILPNGWCLLPPRQVCVKGNACLTCDKFATDGSFLPELRAQQDRTATLIAERRTAFLARTGQQMGEDNVWLAGRRQEHDALGRIILTLERTRYAADDTPAVRGAGVTARTDAITDRQEQR